VKCPYEVPGVMLPIASDHTAGGHHPVPHPLQAIEHHPSGHTELCHLLLVAVTLRLVAELLRQEPHLVVVQSLHSYPPFGFVFSDCDVGHFEASGVDLDFRLSLHFYVAL